MVSRGYHPYNSRNNDKVRQSLLCRIDSILSSSGRNGTDQDQGTSGGSMSKRYRHTANNSTVYVFDDQVSNITFSTGNRLGSNGVSAHFESTNIVVYIRGSEDDQREWWSDDGGEPNGKGGVLVNAHYDSVSMGHGATDDGVGVVTILQLISYYSLYGNTPKRGLVALLNNGEEDFLNGARAFSQHPMSKFTHTFLNLEGAAAGGRATLFRSTDAEVTRAYKHSPHPFGSVVSSDGFEAGLVRSQTDYVVFNGILGMRGLDVAFLKNRARYHTDQDDTRHTGRDSVWHMLSAALETTKALTSDTGDEFEGKRGKGEIDSGYGSRAVWFDLFGRAFAILKTDTMFALSVTLLVVPPLVILLTMFVLYKSDKLYIFSGARLYHHPDGDEEIPLFGWRGFFRFPFIFVIASAVPIILSFLINKYNALIIHSSDWAVWSMMISSWVFVAWFFSRSADFGRPTALTRFYANFWILIGAWVLLVIDVVFQKQFHLAGGYFALFYFAGFFLSAWISYLELFVLPTKSKYCHERMDPSRRPSLSTSQLLAPAGNQSPTETRNDDDGDADDEANESTSLLGRQRRTTFANYTRNAGQSPPSEDHENEIIGSQGRWFGDEQDWSGDVPRWTWLFQLLLSAPFPIILLGQIGFLITQALHQTGADGGSVLIVYLFIALTTILVLTPILPYLHRFTWHIPIFLLLVLIGTLAYNLIAFPFSPQNRLKIYFQQIVDLDKGTSAVSLNGPQPYIGKVVYSLPSADDFGVPLSISPPSDPSKDNRWTYTWAGPAPNVVPSKNSTTLHPSRAPYKDWVTYNISRRTDHSATITLFGRNSRACRLEFETPLSHFHVHNSSPPDPRFPRVPPGGTMTLQLWSRNWKTEWTIDLEWRDSESRMKGKVVCLWNDVNANGLVPALDEVWGYAPGWVAVANKRGGVVEGWKAFEV